jgi:Gas vesicle synthesis protein GvpL/GvpF
LSALRLYAVVRAGAAAPAERGASGEPLRLVACSGVAAVVGKPADFSLSAEALQRHDDTVRRLALAIDPLLPARFGETAPDEAALVRALAPRAAELAEALARVAGCVQMTLRVFGESAELPASAQPEALDEPLAGPGTRYLLQRRLEAERARSLPEIAELRAALAPLLRAERVERHAAGRLLATAYDLVARGDAPRYAELVRSAAARTDGPRVALSGPWPPYAFAPEVRP